MIVAHFYLALMFTLHSIDEACNCSHPRKFPGKNYMVCDWEEDDMFKDKNGKFHPHLKSDNDNYFERKSRTRYWQKKRQDRE